ncbi:dihydropteroate synthase [Ornithinimicrobium sp. INDO-MA30-4]|uniref:dihydropteroate synthase n=1 Tax=Ornithinimicrobium sp. INDO-MA30-4 TaxID=2908651 RepID=UPI001F4810E7|nr:dihydropteroate synthase [Ornithinimicrobium sp. INDO-MA30-4]UJH70496.1 dihydropteroate synthase [Ornithinimicrobium sp. INDO-MA30-4]
MSATREPTQIMGIVNVTPDSFSDGGDWIDPDAAVAHGLELVSQGARFVDVGGESTRPGAGRVEPAEELNRVLPVVAGLAQEGVTVSIDTMKSDVARRCIDAGATLVNDVSGGLADPQMPALIAERQLPFVAMHWRGHSDVMNDLAHYDNIVDEVLAALQSRVEALTTAGVQREQIILDPGFGFAKDAEHNWTLLAGLPQITALGLRVLVGTSRKRFLGQLPSRPGADLDPDAAPSATNARDIATAATSLLAAQAGPGPCACTMSRPLKTPLPFGR